MLRCSAQDWELSASLGRLFPRNHTVRKSILGGLSLSCGQQPISLVPLSCVFAAHVALPLLVKLHLTLPPALLLLFPSIVNVPVATAVASQAELLHC